MTNPSAHTREALEELKVELQLNELQSRWLETKLEALIASEVQAAVQEAKTISESSRNEHEIRDGIAKLAAKYNSKETK